MKVRKNKIKKIEYLYYKPNSLYVKVNGYTYKFTPIFQFQVREIEDLFARDPKAALKKLIGMKGAHFTVKGNPDMKKKNNPPGKVWAPYLRMLAATLTEDAATYNKYYRMVSGDRFISKKKAKEWLRRIGVGDEKVIETAQKMEHFKANPARSKKNPILTDPPATMKEAKKRWPYAQSVLTREAKHAFWRGEFWRMERGYPSVISYDGDYRLFFAKRHGHVYATMDWPKPKGRKNPLTKRETDALKAWAKKARGIAKTFRFPGSFDQGKWEGIAQEAEDIVRHYGAKGNPFDPDQKFWLKKRIKVLKHMARMEKRDPRKRKFYEGRAKEVAYMMKYYGNPKRKKKKARPKKKAKKVTRKATGIIQQLYGGPAWVSIIDLHSEPGWGIRAGEMAKLIKKEARVSAKSEHSPYVGFRAVAIRATSTNDIRKALKVLRRYHKITNVADHYRQIMGNITRGHLIV